MSHSIPCEIGQAIAQEGRDEYARKWPHHCRACEGYGGEISHGVWRYRDGSGEPDDFSPCPECQEIEHPHCPRCSVVWTDEEIYMESRPCPACGWDWGFDPKSGDTVPPEWVCYCFGWGEELGE